MIASIMSRLGFVAGFVNQATRRLEFEDTLRTGVKLVLRSGLQSGHTTLKVKDGRAFEDGLPPKIV